MAFGKIKINKLFNKHDIEVDLSKKCNILIGSNGIGKSTTLKIINSLYQIDMINLAKIPFKSLDIESIADENNHTINGEYCTIHDRNKFYYSHIQYLELFPTKEFLLKAYEKFVENNYKDISNDSNAVLRSGSIINSVEKALDELQENNLYGQFIYNLYAEQLQPQLILSIINRYSDFNINIIKSFINKSWNKETFEGSLIYQKLYGENRDVHLFDTEYDNYYIDLVENYKLKSEYTDRSFIVSETLKWLKDGKNVGTTYRKENIVQKPVMDYRSYGLSPYLYKITDGEIANFYKLVLGNTDDFEMLGDLSDSNLKGMSRFFKSRKGIEEVCIEELLSNKVLDINGLISRFYYEEEFVIEFNRRALKKYRDVIDCRGKVYNYSHEEIENFYYNKEILEYIKNYFKPIIAQNGFFDMDFTKFQRDENGFSCLDYEYDLAIAFFEFYNEEINNLLDDDNINPVMKNYKFLIKKYFTDKYVEIYPDGIHIRERENFGKTKERLTIITYIQNDIEISMLSSGERKILLILSVCFFMKNINLMIDEPELSLSLIWQEQLLPDLLQYGKMKSILVATHSPYVAKDESLRDNIVFLPSRER